MVSTYVESYGLQVWGVDGSLKIHKKINAKRIYQKGMEKIKSVLAQASQAFAFPVPQQIAA